MSVYTPLTLLQVQEFAKDYTLNIIEITPIQGGVENTNYFITADNDTQYVLTIFEEISADVAAELPPVLHHLEQHEVPVATPLQHSNAYIHFIAGKPAQIAPRIIGQHPIPSTVKQVEVMGETLAKLHLALKDYPLKRQGNHDDAWWQQATQQLSPLMSDEEQSVLSQVLAQFQKVKEMYLDRPMGLVHADLFRDNTLYIDNKLSAILDFSEIFYGEFLVDISITLNDFCSDFPSVTLNIEKAKAFLTAYQKVRPLTADEFGCLNTYLAMAACRFWLSRLSMQQRNQAEGRTGEDILQKNPEEMRLMLIDRLTQEYVW